MTLNKHTHIHPQLTDERSYNLKMSSVLADLSETGILQLLNRPDSWPATLKSQSLAQPTSTSAAEVAQRTRL